MDGVESFEDGMHKGAMILRTIEESRERMNL